MATQLAEAPDDGDLLQVLYRELHRIHGTAGSYGYRQASQLARGMEHQVQGWVKDPAVDWADRGAIIAEFVEALEAALVADEPTAEARLTSEHLRP